MTRATESPRGRLLDVAARLFYAEGIHAVGIDRVIAEASVAKATLYAHFPSKADLVAAYLARRSQEWVEANEARLSEQPEGGVGALVALFDLLYEETLRPAFRGCPFINAAAEFPAPGPVWTEVARHRERVRRVFSSAGGPLVRDAATLDALIALYGGATSAAHLDRDPTVVRRAADAARALVASGVAARSTN